jgi:PAS domain-containing protein
MNSAPTTTGRHSFDAPDFAAVFDKIPHPYLVIDTHFTIVAQNQAHAVAARTKPGAAVGRPLFEVFPDNPDDSGATGVSQLRESLLRVLNTRQPDQMEPQQYDVPLSPAEGGGFETRYWLVLNVPLLGSDGYVRWILNSPEDVTELETLRKQRQWR